MTEEIAQLKSRIRKEYAALRDEMSPQEQHIANQSIGDKLLSWVEANWQTVYRRPLKTVALYAAMRSEANLQSLAARLRQQDVATVYPTCFANRKMEFYAVTDESALKRSRFGVPEPIVSQSQVVAATDIDLILVPGLAFTHSGLRLGYGGGFYDTYLSRPELSAVQVGVGYDLQRVSDLPKESFDCVLDYLATEHGVSPCK